MTLWRRFLIAPHLIVMLFGMLACSGEANTESTATASGPTLDVSLTAEASQQIATMISEQQLGSGWYVRVGTHNNNPEAMDNWSGYTLDLTQNVKPGDLWVDSHGFRIIAQPADAEALRGYIIDFAERVGERGFIFWPPERGVRGDE